MAGVDGSSPHDNPLVHTGQPIQDVDSLSLCVYVAFRSAKPAFLLPVDHRPIEVSRALPESAIREFVQDSMPADLIEGLQLGHLVAKIGKAGYGTRLSSGKRFDSKPRRYRAYLKKSAYGSGPTNFNR